MLFDNVSKINSIPCLEIPDMITTELSLHACVLEANNAHFRNVF